MEECSKVKVPAGEHVDSDGGEDSGAGMSFGLPRPEQIVFVPQLPRAKPRREDHALLPQGCQLRRLLGLLLLGLVILRLVALRSHGGGGEERGEEVDGAADAGDGGGREGLGSLSN